MTYICNNNSEVHVMPLDDLREHIECITCWCRPCIDYQNDKIIIHNSMDCREIYERGELKKH